MVQDVTQRPEWYRAQYDGMWRYVAFWGAFLFVADTAVDAASDRFQVIPSHLVQPFEISHRVSA